MCVAVPMQVVELKEIDGFGPGPSVAVVNASGIRKEVRLDIVDRIPKTGDYVIVHAGFALHCLDKHEAEKSLDLFQMLSETTVSKN